jgi:hypothetical protein
VGVPTLPDCSRRPGASLALLGAAAGCADQAHMTRELRLTGPSWTALLSGARSTFELSDLTETAPAG